MTRKEYKGSGEPLRWFEILFCCCKCRAEAKAFFATVFLYYIPILFLLCMAGGCITFGILWREDCDYKTMLPYWLIVSSVTPFMLLLFIKAVKEDYIGVTLWRLVSLLTYMMFIAWLIIGSIWIYDTWGNACDSCCNYNLKLYAFCVTFVHWLFVVLATIPQVIILTRMCCCCEDSAIRPMKSSFRLHEMA